VLEGALEEGVPSNSKASVSPTSTAGPLLLLLEGEEEFSEAGLGRSLGSVTS
jgi:hypothetical protein